MVVGSITVFVVDNQPVFRLGLRRALERVEGVTVIGECSLSDEALGLVSESEPGLLLLGTTIQRQIGLHLCRRIGECCPGLPIIVMTPSEDNTELVEASRAGAWGYISKLAGVDAIIHAIRKTCQGEMPIRDKVAANPEVAGRLLEEFQAMSRNVDLQKFMAPLTPREMELLRQLGRGRSNKEIAGILNITQQTVKNHITGILRKLDVNDRTQAVLEGIRNGWIDLNESAPHSDNAADYVTTRPQEI